MRKEKLPLFRNAQKIETTADLNAPIDKLWEIHDGTGDADRSEHQKHRFLISKSK